MNTTTTQAAETNIPSTIRTAGYYDAILPGGGITRAMTHLRTDNQPLNSKRRFACGLGPSLPEGDKYVFEGEVGLRGMVDCLGCGGQKLGTPISELSGRPGQPGYERFKAIAASWGYD